jgi:hypothetical protein
VIPVIFNLIKHVWRLSRKRTAAFGAGVKEDFSVPDLPHPEMDQANQELKNSLTGDS